MEEKKLTRAQRTALERRDAHGSAHLLAVGVGEHLATSRFSGLKTAPGDAEAVQAAFLEVRQLNADPSKLALLTTKSSPQPSRGIILAKIRDLAKNAGAGDRIIFFFSGHGHKIGKDLYLVPSDAYDSEDSSGLLKFDDVAAELSKSDAKQKIILLDCCFSGPDTTGFKALPAHASDKFLTQYLLKTRGVAVMSSSTESQPSTTLSPNPKLSLFTHYLVTGLRGDSLALNGFFLTIPSLFAYVSQQVQLRSKSYSALQSPGLKEQTDGVIVLADFTPRLLGADDIDLIETPVKRLEFEDRTRQSAKEILPWVKNWGFSKQEWLESKAIRALPEFLADELASKRTALRKAMGWNTSDVVIENASLRFPGGDYAVTYEAVTKKDGKLVHNVTIENDWFSKPGEIPKIISALGLTPGLMRLNLSKACSPLSMTPGLEASGWKTEAEADDKVTCVKGSYSLTIYRTQIEFDGLAPSDIFGSAADKGAKSIALSVLALLPSP